MARNRESNLSILSSLKINASPPLKSTSRTSGVLFEITKRFLEIGVQLLFANAADDAAARAISTITRAAISHEK